MANWKTTVGGLALALAEAAEPFQAALADGSIHWPRFGLALLIAGGGWWARDRA